MESKGLNICLIVFVVLDRSIDGYIDGPTDRVQRIELLPDCVLIVHVFLTHYIYQRERERANVVQFSFLVKDKYVNYSFHNRAKPVIARSGDYIDQDRLNLQAA